MMPFHCPIESNEHLLGWISRVHLLGGNLKFKHTTSSLGISDNPLKSCNHNEAFRDSLNLLPNILNAFENHTVFALWSLSLQTEKVLEWKQCNLKLVPSGSEPNKFAFHSSWKYCPECIGEDINQHGHSIWHVKHQLPSITHCYKHLTPLMSDRVTLRDLRSASLPQAYDVPLPVFDNEPLMIEWSQFILLMFERLNSNPELGRVLRERVSNYLGIPSQPRQKDKPFVVTIQEIMDTEVPLELLEYLFLFYSQEFKRPPSVLWSTLGYSVYEKVKHPIYWLIILYWLKDKISLEI